MLYLVMIIQEIQNLQLSCLCIKLDTVHARLIQWGIWKINRRSFGSKEGNKSSIRFYRSNRTVIKNSPKMNTNGAMWKQLMDGCYLPAYFTYIQQNYTEMRECLQPNSKKSEIGWCFTRTKQILKERQTLKMSVASRNRRGYLQLNKTHIWW